MGGTIFKEEFDANGVKVGMFDTGWLVKTGPDGCPGFPCGDVIQEYTLTSGPKEYPPAQAKVLTFPNPGGDRCSILLDAADSRWDEVVWTDVMGRRVMTAPYTSPAEGGINTESLSPGAYFLSLYWRGTRVGMGKWVKI